MGAEHHRKYLAGCYLNHIMLLKKPLDDAFKLALADSLWTYYRYYLNYTTHKVSASKPNTIKVSKPNNLNSGHVDLRFVYTKLGADRMVDTCMLVEQSNQTRFSTA